MFKYISFFLLLLIPTVFGGCASGSGGNVRYSHVFQPYYSIDVVNNTNLLLDVEYGGELVKKDLTPGETFSYPVWSFSRGDSIYMTVKGHVDGIYVGVETKRFRLSSRGERKHEVWVISRIKLANIYATD